MMKWVAIIAATGLVGSANAAEPAASVSTISAKGDGGWEIICHVLRPRSEQVDRILNAGRTSFSDTELRKASCSVKNSSKTALVVSIAAPTMKCPFKSATPEACEQSFPKSASGSFELVVNANR